MVDLWGSERVQFRVNAESCLQRSLRKTHFAPHYLCVGSFEKIQKFSNFELEEKDMPSTPEWIPVEPNLETILAQHPRPLKDLAEGRIPAVLMRRAFHPEHCTALVRRFYERGLLYDPRTPGGDKPARRVDIGTSLGSHGRNPEGFFAHAKQTHELYETLFDGYDNPVKFIYNTLSALAPDKRVMVAHEPDGRRYGPAIFRTYYEGVGHNPHFDSVSKRSKLSNYAVSRFEKQFAGVLCFQNAEDDEETGQAFLYRHQWTPDMPEGWNKTFHEYASARGIERVRVELEPGDFYVFCSETIHEVPPPRGDRPRIVLAAFFAMSEDEEEIFVWS